MFTDNKDFYPTPSNIISKMLSKIDISKSKNILEPSAWKWNIVKNINWRFLYWTKPTIYTFEKDISLQAILKKEQQIFLWDDFLDYNGDLYFDTIIMNPPFSNWVDHLLKAWEIAKNTKIVCLLNAETIRNPFSEKRKLLLKIIEDNSGEIEYLWNCFSDAERETEVEVAMVTLTKKTEKMDFDFDFETVETEEIKEEDFNGWVMSFNKIASIIAEYKQVKNTFKEYIKIKNKLNSQLNRLPYIHQKEMEDIEYWSSIDQFNKFNNVVKNKIWSDLIKKSNIEKYMTSKLKENFQSYLQEQWNIEITENNIKQFVEFVLINKNAILENWIEEVFDELTKYDKENRYFPEWWKTNDNWKVNEKFILNWCWVSFCNIMKKLEFKRWGNWYDKLVNIDKIMCFISWKSYNNIIQVEDTIKDLVITEDTWVWSESEFFKIKIFKKWTVHFKFKDKWLWQEFNIRATNKKWWLPKWEYEEYMKEKWKELVKI